MLDVQSLENLPKKFLIFYRPIFCKLLFLLSKWILKFLINWKGTRVWAQWIHSPYNKYNGLLYMGHDWLIIHKVYICFMICLGRRFHVFSFKGSPLCVLHFWVWSFIRTLILSFFFSLLPLPMFFLYLFIYLWWISCFLG
jgi:hypothetical protein